MDTKWKKSKAFLGFASFALGVSLLLASLLPVAGCLVNESGREQLQNAWKQDFQETSTFRDYLSDVMNNFIAMGSGGPIGSSYYADYAYNEATTSDILLEATVIQSVEGGNVWYVDDDPSFGYQPTEADRKRWKKDAETWSRQFQDDENILYYVTVDNQVVYTNMDQSGIALPSFPQQGYRFRLSFNGSGCEAQTDGGSLDLYGDGFYRDDGKHWNLPGYSNFQAGEDAAKVRVYLAVADTPQLYVKADYASGWLQRQNNNRYYWHYQNWQSNRQELVLNSRVMAIAGLVLLLLSLLLRKDKGLADRAIAGVTGHIWFEVKVLLLLGALVFLILPLTEDMRYLFQEIAYAVSIEDGGYYQSPWFLSEYLREISRRLETTLLAFWSCWLFVNDLRYGDKPWRNGICGMLRARSLKLPIQKRLSRSSGLMVLTAVVLCCTSLNLLVYWVSFGSLYLKMAWLLCLLPSLLLIATAGYVFRQRRLWQDIGALTDQITAIHDGDLTAPVLPPDSDLGQASQELADIQQGMEKAVAEQTRSERMKVELVTNVSHDIKTPLTSIISYAELLKQEELKPPAGEYVDILCQKAERLRSMVLDVFEVSKAASGNLPVKLEELDLGKLLRQTTADMAETIEAAPVTLRQALPEEPVTIVADGDRLYRVFQNLLQNALKYALEGSRVYLALEVRDGVAEVSLKNTSRTELPEGVDFTGRFVRGDESRTDGGSGLGLAIADSFTRACGGELTVEPIADLFVVRVRFPISGDGED